MMEDKENQDQNFISELFFSQTFVTRWKKFNLKNIVTVT